MAEKVLGEGVGEVGIEWDVGALSQLDNCAGTTAVRTQHIQTRNRQGVPVNDHTLTHGVHPLYVTANIWPDLLCNPSLHAVASY